ncbi:hypothetical protein BDZ91DRAFT_712896 [Kalaharituber pfeilii]|nr:hypothetical protein BDZ91DRAFT_712896 [Kalaharituber pfeilii]
MLHARPACSAPLAPQPTPDAASASPSPPAADADADGDSPAKRRRLDTTAGSSSMHTSRPAIELTPEEENLRRLLIDCAAHVDKTAPPAPPSPAVSGAENESLVLRFTGGWVRDKLLKGQSNDIDVGINKMTGWEFGKHLSAFIREHGSKYGIDDGARGVYRIESNPDKSKHLETATTRIMDLEVDLVNLRSEAYFEDSRIPTMEFGTPVQDALRRDATVNALFYNLHTQEVEDFTERGLQDMEDRLIRTPLKPWETFNDDPLRVLRLIRFASRLGFEIVPEVKDAMKDEGIKKALRLKISRERVGTEVEKMLKGKDPYLSLSLIDEMGLFTSIFCPPVEALPELPVEHLTSAINILNYIFTHPPTSLSKTFSTAYEQFLAWHIAAVIPWNGRVVGEKHLPAAAVGSREGLKLPNKEYKVLVAAYKSVEIVKEMAAKNEEKRRKEQGGLSRGEAGRIIRSMRGSWRSQVLCGLMVESTGVWSMGADGLPTPASLQLVEKYDNLVHRIYELGLEEAFNVAPALNGNEMSMLLDRKPGPWVRDALERLLDWQFSNPEKGLEEVKEFVLEEFAEEK